MILVDANILLYAEDSLQRYAGMRYGVGPWQLSDMGGMAVWGRAMATI